MSSNNPFSKAVHPQVEHFIRYSLNLTHTKITLMYLYFNRFFKFPCDALEEVIIGANAGKEFLEKITNLIKQDSELSHVIIKRDGVSESEYRLTFTDL